jgi:hypothetical protein
MTTVTPENLPIKTTDEAREYLTTWMREHFPTDRTFARYIGERLAGDFAWQLANALARRTPVSTPTAGERQSIADDAEFQELAGELWNAGSYNESMEKPMNALVAYVDTLLRAGRSAGDEVPAGLKQADESNVLPPFAAPAGQHNADPCDVIEFALDLAENEGNQRAMDFLTAWWWETNDDFLRVHWPEFAKLELASRGAAQGRITCKESASGAAPESAAPIAIITGLMGSSNGTVPVKIEWAESAAPVVQPEVTLNQICRCGNTVDVCLVTSCINALDPGIGDSANEGAKGAGNEG